MGYEYRVFIETPAGDTDAMHYSQEKLYEGAIFRVNKPETAIHGQPVLVHRVDSHPGLAAIGIAWARTEEMPRPVARL
jgi:hypothetical protein